MKERFTKVRKANHLTQAEFGNKIGVTGAAISRIESGDREPSDVVIKAVCREFNVRREWLELGHEPMMSEELYTGAEALVPDLVETLSAYPAVLDMLRRVINHMTPADWARLNQLLDDVQTQKGEE